MGAIRFELLFGPGVDCAVNIDGAGTFGPGTITAIGKFGVIANVEGRGEYCNSYGQRPDIQPTSDDAMEPFKAVEELVAFAATGSRAMHLRTLQSVALLVREHAEAPADASAAEDAEA